MWGLNEAVYLDNLVETIVSSIFLLFLFWKLVILEKSNNNVQMKNLLIFLLISTTSFAQNKKEQIEILNFRVDSLNTVLATTRDNSAKDISLLNDYIKKVERTALKSDLTNLQTSNNKLSKENEKFKTDLGELSKKNLELEAKLEAVELEKTSFKTVKIGNQVWMAENLNVDKFLNGDPILEAKTEEEWKKAGDKGQPAWCYYDNDPANGAKYGKLYNWYAVNDSRGIAPMGYRVSANTDWGKLATMIKSDYPNLKNSDISKEIEDMFHYSIAMSLASVDGWFGEDEGGSNASGFNALPAGYLTDGGFIHEKGGTCFWSKEGGDIWIGHEGGIIGFSIHDDEYYKDNGYYIRCIIEE